MSAGAENYMFRVSMVDREQVAGLMAYVKKNPAAKNVGYLAETTGYGQGGLKDIQELGELQGIKPACNEKFGVNDTDMTSQLNKCKAAGVDTIVVWAQGTPLGQLMRSMEKINYFPLDADVLGRRQPELLRGRWQDARRKPDLHAHGDGGTYATPAEALRPRCAEDDVAERLRLRGPLLRRGHAAGRAIKQANSTEGAKVREALENLQAPYEGVMKTYNKPFSTTVHEALRSKDYRWAHWKDGKLLPYSDDVIKSLTEADFKKYNEHAGSYGDPRTRTRDAEPTSTGETPMLIALLQAVVSGLAVGGAYALIALGFSITFTTTKTLNFSHGDFVSVGAFIGVTVLWLLLGKPINAPLVGRDAVGAGSNCLPLSWQWS